MPATSIVLPACASLAAPPLTDVLRTDLGKWVDEDGKTHYVIDRDTLARQGCVRLRLCRQRIADAYGKAARHTKDTACTGLRWTGSPAR